MSTPPPDDETRLASSTGSGQSTGTGHFTGTATGGASSGWLASSGAIDHCRFPPGTILGGRYRPVVPLLDVFLRYGLLALTASMTVNQALQTGPLTLDLSKPHALASSMAIILILGLAAYAFSISRAGAGLLRRLVPAA